MINDHEDSEVARIETVSEGYLVYGLLFPYSPKSRISISQESVEIPKRIIVFSVLDNRGNKKKCRHSPCPASGKREGLLSIWGHKSTDEEGDTHDGGADAWQHGDQDSLPNSENSGKQRRKEKNIYSDTKIVAADWSQKLRYHGNYMPIDSGNFLDPGACGSSIVHWLEVFGEGQPE